MGIGLNIRRLRESHGLTQEEFGKIANVSSMAVSQWENSRAVPRMGAVQAIADYFNISKGEILDEPGQIPPNAIPVVASEEATVPLVSLGRVHAGSFEDEDAHAGRVEVPASVAASHPRAFALEVEGDCMDRVVPEGSHVLVDPDREPGNGSIAVVETEDYRAVMRRWYRGASTLLLSAESYSPHEDIVLGPDSGPVRVIGTVVWWQAAKEME